MTLQTSCNLLVKRIFCHLLVSSASAHSLSFVHMLSDLLGIICEIESAKKPTLEVESEGLFAELGPSSWAAPDSSSYF